MGSEEVGGGLDFVQVYQAQLAPVWRYVRSRISNHHEAQDVTSEVFARAWRSWGRFDPARGDVAPWLFRIAQRTVVDWNRRHGRPGASDAVDLDLIENAPVEPGELPETIVLAREVLAEVGQALSQLSVRERDGIALRFGAGLRMAAVGQVLGLSTGATKMMMARALTKMASAVAVRRGRPAAVEMPLLLDDLVDQALERGRGALTPELRDLVLQLAVIHRPKMPADLPKQVQVCVDCATGLFGRMRSRLPGPAREKRPPTLRFGLATSAAFSWVPLAPICLACTIPLLIAPLLALGLNIGVAYGLHALSLVTAPLVVFVLYRHLRRHRERLALSVGGVGGALLIAHFIGHVLVAVGVPPWSVVADQLGTALLLGGTVLDAGALRAWALRQRKGLAIAAAGFRLVPA
jgi:RNA polymerase sigma factor (sigma-70 family)